MQQVDPSHFTNVILAVQRTARLTGGAVRGLPGGLVIDGLQGVSSFGSDIAEAQKEFELGRIQSSLTRVRQIEMQFQGIAGRWGSTVTTIIATAKQGRQQLPAQKLNEVKAAQGKMQQLISPAEKAFRDLVSALEHAVSSEGHHGDDEQKHVTDNHDDRATEENDQEITIASQTETINADDPVGEQPDRDLLGSFASKYRFGAKLQLRKDADNKTHIRPPLEDHRFYFVSGYSPPRVIRLRQRFRQSILVYDTLQSCERQIDGSDLKKLINQGMWLLVSDKV